MMKKLSIKTINKNNKQGLEKTINSVISQTFYNKIQFIIIDGNSNDGSREILDPSKYIVISEPDNGIFNAMNKGINLAEGEYCLFLNSGDYLISNTIIEEVYNLLDTNTDIISFPYIYYPSQILRTPPSEDKLLDIFLYWSLPHHSTFIKTSLLKDRPYDESFEILGDADLFFDLLIMQSKSYKTYSNNICFVDDGGISKQKNYECRIERRKMFLKYPSCSKNPKIKNYLDRNNFPTIFVAIKDFDKVTKETLESIDKQIYPNIQIIDYIKDLREKNIPIIIIEHDDILTENYVKDFFNNYIFQHSFNRDKI